MRQQPRPADWPAVEDLLGLIARAIQQLHTYPATSPMCVNAIEACQRALVALDSRDQLTVRVTPAELIVDDQPMGKGTQVGTELAKRLHKASVASVTVDRAASARELGRFCQDLVHCGDRGASTATLLDLLTEHGVERVSVTMASRPEVLEIGTVPESADDEVARERVRFDAQLGKGGVVSHLFPPDKGWVRIDPSSAPRAVSLLDLAVLADDPMALASMLLRLTDDAQDVSPAEALDKKYSDVAMLISALDPRVARRMFGKLARAVLDLESTARQALLRRTVLPGLLDGRVDGAILRDFPDVDLAESLCLLLDLETAAPELLSTALSRLELSADRQAAVVPLLESHLRERAAVDPHDERQNTLAKHARELVRIDSQGNKTFAEFAAFDLAVDETATEMLGEIRAAVPATDTLADQLTCLWHLVGLEPNPETATRFLTRSFQLLATIEHAGRGAELPSWLAGYRELADRFREARPDVADAIVAQFGAFCTPARAAWIADLAAQEPEGRAAAGAVVAALGPSVAAPLVALLERDGNDKPGPRRGKAIAQMLVEHAAVVAPALPPLLERAPAAVARTLLRVLGAAGPGFEDVVGAYVASPDEQTSREALRALARLGTTKAARLVVTHIVRQQGRVSLAAEETLWHFPADEAQRQARELLGKREFTMSHPKATERLLDRAARSGNVDLGPVLTDLAPMRFRFWNPALARVARKAHSMLNA